MEQNEQIDRLESLVAGLRGREDMMLIAFSSLLSGEISEAVIARRMESLIANALNTNAPDAAVAGIETAGSAILAALAHRSRRESAGTNPG